MLARLAAAPGAAKLAAMSPSAPIDEQRVPLVLEQALERFRAVRRELETSVLPLASSLDGSRFTFQASLHGLEVRLGAYVVIEQEGRSRLGQVLALEMTQAESAALDLPGDDGAQGALRSSVAMRYARGEGALLEGDGTPFHDAMVRPATTHEVREWTRRSQGRAAVLEIGELALAPGVVSGLDAAGFDRHTFLCGQSGSGKTYSLGVVLESLLTETGLRIVVLDPNSDFVRLASIREDAEPAAADRYRAAAGTVAIHSARADGERRLRIRLGEIEPAARATLLRLDPIVDREEHAALADMLAERRPTTVAEMSASPEPERRRLALRARNLGLEDLGVWAGAQAGSTLDAIRDQSARCVVVDLGSLATPEEQALTAGAVLGELWRRREERNPVLIVIDEAHNVCPGRPADPLVALATAHAVRIAAEGRKFGLYLLVSTQRPQKVHENVLSQCDNLLLMRMNSTADLGFVGDVFSFVPRSLLERATDFRQGESLAAGKISPHPALIRFGARVSEEGGGDVPADWAAGR